MTQSPTIVSDNGMVRMNVINKMAKGKLHCTVPLRRRTIYHERMGGDGNSWGSCEDGRWRK